MNKKIMQVRNVLHDRSAPNPLQMTPSISCGRFNLRCTKSREARIHLRGPPFPEGAFKMKQKTGHTPDSIASSCGENDVEMDSKGFVEDVVEDAQDLRLWPSRIELAFIQLMVEERKTVVAPDDVWDQYVKMVLFANSQATGSLACASTQGPPTSDEERDIQSAFFDVGINSNTGSFLVGDEIEGDDDPKVGWSSGNDGGRKGAHLDLALDAWIAMNLAKKEFYIRQNKMTEASQAEKKQYSIEACMDYLATMDGITPDQYVKACESFHDKATRRMFMRMLPVMKMHWVCKLA
ncbi:unnamed protein product [Camellia sinensis]